MDNVLKLLDSLKINNKYIIVACSGGPDSMFLLNMLYEQKYNIICAHVNHKIREESDDEYKFVENFCKERNIKFEGIELSGYVTGNFEFYAREFRYSFFESLLKKYSSDYLFTAHHGDDLMETILMRLVRGSSLKGYKGFSLVTKRNDYEIIRPLIYLTKDNILTYNKENNIPFVIDESNNEDNYTRNRFRHHVLPFLKEEDALVHEKFILYNNELTETLDYINSLVKNNITDMYNNNILDLIKFKKIDNYLQKKIIEYILSELYPDNLFLINSNHIKEILKIITSQKPNLRVILPNNINILKDYDLLYINYNNKLDTNYKYLYDSGLVINGYIFDSKNSDDESNFTIRLNSKDIKLPLYIRTKHNGDKMQVKNMKGKKKISDIFIDGKVSKNIRDAYPILVDSDNQILWVPGLKKSQFDVSKTQEYDIIIEYQKKERD